MAKAGIFLALTKCRSPSRLRIKRSLDLLTGIYETAWLLDFPRSG
jgi:hypothetical protein